MIKKHLFVIIICIITFTNINAQFPLGVGKNNDPMLNKAESNFLNKYYKRNKGSFNFTGKKIWFAYAYNEDFEENKDIRTCKEQFFYMAQNDKKLFSRIIVLEFNEKEKLKNSDGIIYFSKSYVIQTNESRGEIINEIVEFEKKYPQYINEMGQDNNEFLNFYEEDYFKYKFDTEYIFRNKTVGYYYYNYKNDIIHFQGKMDYFSKLKKRKPFRYYEYEDKLLVDKKEMLKLDIYGNYDAVIITFNKSSSPSSERRSRVLYSLIFPLIMVLLASAPTVLGPLLLKFIARFAGVYAKFKSSFLIIFISCLPIYLVSWLLGISKIFYNDYHRDFSYSAFIMIFIVQVIVLIVTEIIIWRISFRESLIIAVVYSIISSFIIYIVSMFMSVGDMMLS